MAIIPATLNERDFSFIEPCGKFNTRPFIPTKFT